MLCACCGCELHDPDLDQGEPRPSQQQHLSHAKCHGRQPGLGFHTKPHSRHKAEKCGLFLQLALVSDFGLVSSGKTPKQPS